MLNLAHYSNFAKPSLPHESHSRRDQIVARIAVRTGCEFDHEVCLPFKLARVELLPVAHKNCQCHPAVFRGWCQYYAVPGNYPRLQQFRDAIQETWLRTLRRRSQRGRHLTWDKFSKLSCRWLPTPKIIHPYPNVRFASQHPR